MRRLVAAFDFQAINERKGFFSFPDFPIQSLELSKGGASKFRLGMVVLIWVGVRLQHPSLPANFLSRYQKFATSKSGRSSIKPHELAFSLEQPNQSLKTEDVTMKAMFLTATTSLLLALALCYAGTLGATSLSNNKLTVAATKSGNPPPDLALVNALDKVIQQRFLTAPNFGIRRIGPTPNPHLEHFEPRNAEELQTVTNLQNADWKVGIYLIGRRAYEIPSPKEGNASKRLTVYYHLNQPVPVTKNVKKRELPNPKRIKEHADEAFQRFASTDTYDFPLGKWTYVARPLRAKEMCLKCHTDFYLTSKENKVYAYRKRRVGDPIGVVLYAVRKEQ